MKKSQLVGLVLTFFFGPLGLFYSSVAAAIAMTIIAVVVASFTLGIGLLFVWPLCMLMSIYTVHRYNSASRLENRRHEELLDAARNGKVNRPD